MRQRTKNYKDPLINIFNSWGINNKYIKKMELTCPACPVQFEGKLTDGAEFYFRERGGYTSFDITKRNKTVFYKEEREEHYASSAAKRIDKWVKEYFKLKKGEKNGNI